jgi:hypothetical protein
LVIVSASGDAMARSLAAVATYHSMLQLKRARLRLLFFVLIRPLLEHHPQTNDDVSNVVLGIPNAEESATDCEDVGYVTLSSTTQASITL